MNTKVLELATALADAIKTSDEVKRIKEAEAAVMANDEAKALLSDFNAMQERLAANNGMQDCVAMDALNRKLLAKRSELDANDLTREFLCASDDYDNMVEKVNTMLVTAVNPQSSCAPTSCASCDGCS